MTVYVVWYVNPELSNNYPAMYGIYTSYKSALNALDNSGFVGWINEEEVIGD